ncbi:hypothetical protein ACTJIL_01125 [Luteimonas sp. 22616]|uniref:hypothetical protein n=1 Tax=Luteimonas sp. 22616 TaxID=3453951 RepID=UPI003F859132
MQQNPYAAPTAVLRGDAAGAVRLYSPSQVACGALVGGPVGLIYFLRANFSALGNDRLVTTTLLVGVALIVALIAILPLLPEDFPGSLLSILYIVTGRHVAEKHQISKQAIAASDRFAFHSNWRVFWIGLLCLLASFVVLVLPLMLLAAAGVWTP